MHAKPRDMEYSFRAGDFVRSKTGATGYVQGWLGRDLVHVMIASEGKSRLVAGMPAVFTPDALTLVVRVDE